MNVLFICSRNQWRSRTAETIFKNHGEHQVKSAGTAPSARIRVTAALLNWADMTYVMEDKHLELLKTKFPKIVASGYVEVLDIPDEYSYMDEELVAELRDVLKEIF